MAEHAETDIGGRTALLTKGEVNAYAEIEYVQAHLEEMEVVKNTLDTRSRASIENFRRCQMVTRIFPVPRRRISIPTSGC
jgi:hypothetical protein